MIDLPQKSMERLHSYIGYALIGVPHSAWNEKACMWECPICGALVRTKWRLRLESTSLESHFRSDHTKAEIEQLTLVQAMQGAYDGG